MISFNLFGKCWEITRDTRKVPTDAYSVVVVFQRFHSDDDAILEEKGWPVTQDNLIRQIAAELQEVGYDQGGMAGFFQVVKIEEGSKHFQRAVDFGKRSLDA